MFLDWDIPYKFSHQLPSALSIIFEIPIKNDRTVYMSCRLFESSEAFIVILDTQKFIQAWRKSKDDPRFPGYHKGNEALWCSDVKFNEAEQGFSFGEINPVPIANSISCVETLDYCDIGFTDGVTRTIWLLANRAEYMPISVRSISRAELFYNYAGRQSCVIYPCQGLYEHWMEQHNQKNNELIQGVQ